MKKLLFALGFWFPGAFHGFDNQAFFDGAGSDAEVFDLAIDNAFDALKVGDPPTLGCLHNVGTDTALFLSLSAANDSTTFDRSLTC
jgi:hypothetical protein